MLKEFRGFFFRGFSHGRCRKTNSKPQTKPTEKPKENLGNPTWNPNKTPNTTYGKPFNLGKPRKSLKRQTPKSHRKTNRPRPGPILPAGTCCTALIDAVVNLDELRQAERGGEDVVPKGALGSSFGSFFGLFFFVGFQGAWIMKFLCFVWFDRLNGVFFFWFEGFCVKRSPFCGLNWRCVFVWILLLLRGLAYGVWSVDMATGLLLGGNIQTCRLCFIQRMHLAVFWAEVGDLRCLDPGISRLAPMNSRYTAWVDGIEQHSLPWDTLPTEGKFLRVVTQTHHVFPQTASQNLISCSDSLFIWTIVGSLLQGVSAYLKNYCDNSFSNKPTPLEGSLQTCQTLKLLLLGRKHHYHQNHAAFWGLSYLYISYCCYLWYLFWNTIIKSIRRKPLKAVKKSLTTIKQSSKTISKSHLNIVENFENHKQVIKNH